jgi:hypothetical protein
MYITLNSIKMPHTLSLGGAVRMIKLNYIYTSIMYITLIFPPHDDVYTLIHSRNNQLRVRDTS